MRQRGIRRLVGGETSTISEPIADCWAGDSAIAEILYLTTRVLAPNTIAPVRSTATRRSWLDDPGTLEDVT